ncbi:MAG: DedA family protein [Deltaproteobacteria bacterium]|nr:DedA family protein [Deltaproteobacteria bacterium]
MFHHLLTVWFQFVLDWHYLGVFLLMALESTVVPIPSEIIIPPAAYWASQGQMNFWGVVAAGTFGSYFGSVISYFVSQWVGRPFLLKFGKYFFITPQKLAFAEKWALKYGAGGVFLSRLLPVARHLISIPAGILRMNFLRFSVATLTGSGLWCFVLAWFGREVIGDQPSLMQDPAVLAHVLKAKLIYFAIAVLVLGALYFIIRRQIEKGSHLNGG